MNLKFKKVYGIGKKADQPRMYFRHLVCEAAGLEIGQEVYVKVNEEEPAIILQNQPFENEDGDKIHVSSFINKNSGKRRPLIDTAKGEYNSIISIKEKAEVLVYREGSLSRIIVRPLRFNFQEKEKMGVRNDKRTDERLRLLSIAAGAGLGTSCFVDSNYFVPVQEIEIEDDSALNLLYNYPNSYVFQGDLRNENTAHESDVAFCTLPCNEFSSLGQGTEDVFNNLVLATYHILEASNASLIIFENVPSFFKSKGYIMLQELLKSKYPFWSEKNIESYDFGTIARRNRTYSIAAQSEELFFNFQWPTPPSKPRRHKLKKYLDHASVEHEWKSLAKWEESFNSREAWRNRSLKLTFVDEEAREIQCIVKRYRSHCASNTYLLNKEKTHWRFLSLAEIRRILGIPDWFEFHEDIPLWRQYEQIGQGVDGNVIKAIANQCANAFVKAKVQSKEIVRKVKQSVTEAVSISSSGQLGFVL